MSNMDKDKDLSDFIAMGKECGLADEALLTFAKEELLKYNQCLSPELLSFKGAKSKIQSNQIK